MKGKGKIITAVVAAAAVAGIIFYFTGNKEPETDYEKRPAVSAEKPDNQDILLYADLTGMLEPQLRASVMPKIGGEVLELYFQAGDWVEEGQALCRIDTDALTTLKLNMEAAEVAVGDANRALERTQSLFATGAVSQQALEQAQSAAKNAAIQYNAAKNQYDLQLEYTTVTAPISGTVESRSIEPHDHVNTSTEICTISGKEQLMIKFGVTEKILKNISVGDSIDIAKNGVSYNGSIMEIGSMVNSETGLYDVKASVPSSNGLSTGARAKVTVVMDRSLDAMTIPLAAVSYDNGTPYVYCYDEASKTAVKTVIEAGIYDSSRMEVLSGLDENSMVITSWSNELMDGEEVLIDSEINSEPEETRQKAGE